MEQYNKIQQHSNRIETTLQLVLELHTELNVDASCWWTHIELKNLILIK